tara:strand:+ start:3390 stop:3701 length:312 start_codon:yes stop_codon:yes gene_type:complete
MNLTFLFVGSILKNKKENKLIDLSICRPGDVLISSLGATLKYVEKLSSKDYMDHKVKYIRGDNVIKNSYGSRDGWGFVYKKNRKDTDHNIAEIIKALIVERKK